MFVVCIGYGVFVSGIPAVVRMSVSSDVSTGVRGYLLIPGYESVSSGVRGNLLVPGYEGH